jgi:nucleotide-binding universal stress UspA family protein
MTSLRALLAVDGSAHAGIALELVRSVRWPEGSTVRLMTVVEPPLALYALPTPPAPTFPADVQRLESDLEQNGESILESAAGVLAPAGVDAERRIVRGRPGTAIVDEAVEWSADLVVVGSRGHGAIGSMLLGSVSAEVVDHAPCPVLVARRPSLSRVVLGHDGSEFAQTAEEVIRAWPIFRDSPVEVVSVAHIPAPWHTGLAPTIYAEALDAYADSASAAAAEHTRIAQESARRLEESGLSATATTVDGEPAATLVRVADEHAADLIVVGTHGRTGIVRALLGSVARNVMQHATCSVLVVRTNTPQPPEVSHDRNPAA